MCLQTIQRIKIDYVKLWSSREEQQLHAQYVYAQSQHYVITEGFLNDHINSYILFEN